MKFLDNLLWWYVACAGFGLLAGTCIKHVLDAKHVTVDACDPSTPGEYQVEALGKRWAAGVEVTPCDLMLLEEIGEAFRRSDRCAG